MTGVFLQNSVASGDIGGLPPIIGLAFGLSEGSAVPFGSAEGPAGSGWRLTLQDKAIAPQ